MGQHTANRGEHRGNSGPKEEVENIDAPASGIASRGRLRVTVAPRGGGGVAIVEQS